MEYRQHCTYCDNELGMPIFGKDRATGKMNVDSMVIQCRAPKCSAVWGHDLDYRAHV